MRFHRVGVESKRVACETMVDDIVYDGQEPSMPLSEDEQRILRQIEQELEQDPSFSERGVALSRRRLVMSILGASVGIVATVLSLAVSFLLAFVIFVGVVALGVIAANEIAVIGREQMSGASMSSWAAAARARRQG